MNGDIMEYAEDLVCWSGEVVVSRRLMERFARHLRQVGLSMNTEKTVIMRVGRGEKEVQIIIEGERLRNVDQFLYLEGVFTSSGG